MSNQTLPPLTGDDTAEIASRYAFGAAETNGTDYQAELKRFLSWTVRMQHDGTRDLERMVQDLENENARLMQALEEAEARLQEQPATAPAQSPVEQHAAIIRRSKRVAGALDVKCECGWKYLTNERPLAEFMAENHQKEAAK